MISEIDIEFAVDEEERILSDVSLYGELGESWDKIFELMPELLLVDWDGHAKWPGYKRRIARAVQMLEDARARFEGSSDEAVNSVKDGRDDVGELIGRWRAIAPEEEVQRTVLDLLLSNVHGVCVVNYLVIEDRETLEREEGLLLIAFVDAWGRLVRSKRVTSEEGEMMGGMWLESAVQDMSEFEEGEIGGHYEKEEAWEELINHELRS